MQPVLHTMQLALSGLNPLDWAFALTLAMSTITAFMRGLILSVISLAGLLAGVLAAAFYSVRVSPYLLRWTGSASLARVGAFVLILASVYMAAALLGRLLRGAFSAVGLGFLDRLAGAAFGFARGVLLLAALILPLTPYLRQFAVAHSSVLLPYLLPAAHGISFVMPRHVAERLPAADWMLSDRSIFQGRSADASRMTRRLR